MCEPESNMVAKYILPVTALALVAMPAWAKESKSSTEASPAATAAQTVAAAPSAVPAGASVASSSLDSIAPDKLTVQMPVKSSDAQLLGTVAGVAVDATGKVATVVVKPAQSDDQGLRAITAQQGRVEADSIITTLSLEAFKALPVVNIGAAQNQNAEPSPSAQN